MASQIRWLVDKRIIYMSTSGTVTMDDVRSCNLAIMEMLEVGTPFIHVISDSTDMQKNEIGLGDLVTMIKTVPSSPKMGWSIYVSKNKLDRFFASVTMQLSKTRNREFDSVEKALAFLMENDDTLSDIPMP
jgi:hypothetical protein